MTSSRDFRLKCRGRVCERPLERVVELDSTPRKRSHKMAGMVSYNISPYAQKSKFQTNFVIFSQYSANISEFSLFLAIIAFD